MILLLAPDTPERTRLAGELIERGELVTAHDPAGTQPAKIVRSGIGAIVLDLGARESLKFLRRYAALPERVPVVAIADRRKPESSSEALRLGALDIIARPITADDVLIAVGNAHEFARLPEQSPAPTLPVPEVVAEGVFGASAAMRDVLAIVRRVAPSRCAVLIVGERGTGREMVARAIHDVGPRRTRPFLRFVCGGVAEEDLAPILGDGAPEDATIYLENISELPLELQLRIEEAIAVDRPLRFIAGAQPRLFDWIDRGLVRQEFADAFSVVRIDLPPLRQRPDDIPLLALHFLKEASRRNEVPLKTFTRSALSLLGALPWPGNAAELRSLCERLAVLVPRRVVLLEDVLANVRLDAAEAMGRSNESLREARDRFERDYVTAVLQQHKGRIGAAAHQLGIERTNLYRKMKQLNIRWAASE